MITAEEARKQTDWYNGSVNYRLQARADAKIWSASHRGDHEIEMRVRSSKEADPLVSFLRRKGYKVSIRRPWFKGGVEIKCQW